MRILLFKTLVYASCIFPSKSSVDSPSKVTDDGGSKGYG